MASGNEITDWVFFVEVSIRWVFSWTERWREVGRNKVFNIRAKPWKNVLFDSPLILLNLLYN